MKFYIYEKQPPSTSYHFIGTIEAESASAAIAEHRKSSIWPVIVTNEWGNSWLDRGGSAEGEATA